MYKWADRDLIICAAAAEILGISKAAVYAGLRKGIVRYELRHCRMMVDPHRLVKRWRGVSDREAWAQRCNSYLDCSAWGRRHSRRINGRRSGWF